LLTEGSLHTVFWYNSN